MPFYTSPTQFYDCLGELFGRISAEGEASLQSLTNSKLVFRFQCLDPSAEITINGRTTPAQHHFGPVNLPPTLEITLPADTLHHIMLGELGIMKALGSGKLKVKGPMLKARALGDLFGRSQALYPQVLREKGLL
jgi:putative sterol carrier protein